MRMTFGGAHDLKAGDTISIARGGDDRRWWRRAWDWLLGNPAPPDRDYYSVRSVDSLTSMTVQPMAAEREHDCEQELEDFEHLRAVYSSAALRTMMDYDSDGAAPARSRTFVVGAEDLRRAHRSGIHSMYGLTLIKRNAAAEDLGHDDCGVCDEARRKT